MFPFDDVIMGVGDFQSIKLGRCLVTSNEPPTLERLFHIGGKHLGAKLRYPSWEDDALMIAYLQEMQAIQIPLIAW